MASQPNWAQQELLERRAAESGRSTDYLRLSGQWQDEPTTWTEVPTVVGLDGLAKRLRESADSVDAGSGSLGQLKLALREDQLTALLRDADAKSAQVLQLVHPAGKAATSIVQLTSARQRMAGRPWTREQRAELLRQHEALQANGSKKEPADGEIADAWGIDASTVKQQRLKAAREREAVLAKSKAGT